MGESDVQWMRSNTLAGVALITENELRGKHRNWRVKGKYEWVIGGALDYDLICEETKLLQSEISGLLGVAA
ncbi:MAG: hypothetical protein ACK5LJ_06390 [Paracoccus sp. (in: a-proteobacteria)]